MTLQHPSIGTTDIIHLIIDHRENRSLLAAMLSRHYHTTLAEAGRELDSDFDLAIVDGSAFDRIVNRIVTRKKTEASFLPFLLIAPSPGRAATHLWREVDEILRTPVLKLELVARVEMLLRARRLSREAEERYFSLAGTTPVGVFILQNERLIRTNAAFNTLLAEPAEGLSKDSFLAFVPPEERKGLVALWQAVLEGGTVAQPVTARLVLPRETRWLELYASRILYREAPAILGIAADFTTRKEAEMALRESEKKRIELQTELSWAAWVQSKLLPDRIPKLKGFDIAARCLPARQVGGDFYDWEEIGPGVLALTLGDVMGHGIAAAMLMTTVRATFRTLAGQSTPLQAVKLAERALRRDLNNSESFVTLFHARLDVTSRRLTYVDCGHGYEFLHHTRGTVQTLRLRGIPLGIPFRESYREGTFVFHHGDTLVLYSDGLIEAHPELGLTHTLLAEAIKGATTARNSVETLLTLPGAGAPPSDDVTVMVIRCLQQKKSGQPNPKRAASKPRKGAQQ